MALRSLERYGLRLDELNRIRATDEEVDGHANDLKDHCDEFMMDINEFQRISDSFIGIFDHVSSAVEKEKVELLRENYNRERVGTKYHGTFQMAAIGARNLLQTYAKQREAQTQQLTSLIREKQMLYDRMQNQLASLMRLESTQNDFIEQFILQK